MKVTDLLVTGLRVTGFKSFVDPVALKIEPGLTGIVGPNGCGKSNILESLRWVMGATSARALRGGEMDDVIFAGTDKRPARDLAEVTLVLDNSAGKAPAPFDVAPVLEITRKIRRAAGSTFRINGKEVRARDVQLLFADASTGANSPALVRQNQVSELINAKPENRRRILEEAAGISGLYTRRHEAELKLRGVQTNLERLDDIIEAMNAQVSSLRTQAKKALRYRTIADEIRGLEAFLFAKRRAASQMATHTARTTLTEAERALGDATLAANKANAQAENSDDGIAALRQEQTIAEAVLRRIEGQKFALERDLKAAQDALSSAKNDIARIEADQGREASLLEDAQTNLARLNSEAANLPQDQDLAASIATLEAQRNDAIAARQIAEAALTQALTARATAQGERNAQKRACDDARAQLSRRQAAQAGAQRELDRLKAALPSNAGLETAKADADTAAQGAAAAGDQADAAEKQSEEAGVREQTARDLARQSQNSLDRLVSEIKGLEAATRTPTKGNWPKILDQVQAKPGYERALAAALGDELDASLDASAPSAWLEAGSDAIAWRGLDQGQGAVILAEAMAAFPAALGPRLRAVLVVDDAKLNDFKTLPTGVRVVTRSGQMRRWDGFVRKADAVASNAALLEQRARLVQLNAQLGEATALANSHASASAAARALADQSRAKAKAARTDAPRAFAALGLAREKVTKLEAEFARAYATLDQAKANLASMDLECEQATALVKVTEELLAALPEVNDTGQFVALEQAVAQSRAQASQADSELALAKGQLNARQSRRAAIGNDIAGWNKRAQTATARISALETELSNATARKASALHAPQEIETRGRDILAQTPAAQGRKAAADDALVKLETAIRQAREQARITQNTLADCREARALAQTRLEAEVTRLDELEDEIKRSLQISPEDCEAKARDMLGAAFDTLSAANGESRLAKLFYDRDALGGVNLRADEEVVEQEARLTALITDKDDLIAAVAKLRGGVDQINAEGKARLVKAFEEVHKHFKVLFEALFDGGVAELQLTDSDDPLGGGLEVFACPPGKKMQSLTLMSGGEQALTASALIFAVFLSNPSPICVLDEVDAPLDDSNVDRYCRLLNEMRERTQTRFIVITHHPITMARMDRLFGVTMAERGVSQVVSVDLQRAEELIASA